MANQEHLDILKQGVETWNQWREAHPDIIPNLFEADLCEFNLSGANFSNANLDWSALIRTDLDYANLVGADLTCANLIEVFFHGANLSGAYLVEARLFHADLSYANLTGANLDEASLIRTDLSYATLTGCSIYGIAAWDVQLEGAKQENLIITRKDEPIITVDNLEVAQFIYLLLNNSKIRDVIDTVAKKAVLILGRFTPERKDTLDALRTALRTIGYVPILFDFDKPSSRNFTETVRTLAHLSRFIIADLTDPSSIPQELQAIIPTLRVPVQPILLEGKREYAMFIDFQDYHWVLPTHHYQYLDDLLASLQTKAIAPAEQKALELEKQR